MLLTGFFLYWPLIDSRSADLESIPGSIQKQPVNNTIKLTYTEHKDANKDIYPGEEDTNYHETSNFNMDRKSKMSSYTEIKYWAMFLKYPHH